MRVLCTFDAAAIGPRSWPIRDCALPLPEAIRDDMKRVRDLGANAGLELRDPLACLPAVGHLATFHDRHLLTGSAENVDPEEFGQKEAGHHDLHIESNPDSTSSERRGASVFLKIAA